MPSRPSVAASYDENLVGVLLVYFLGNTASHCIAGQYPLYSKRYNQNCRIDNSDMNKEQESDVEKGWMKEFSYLFDPSM